MKKQITIIIFLLSLAQVFAQIDKNGNPVFNSITTDEKQIEDFVLISNYYTLSNNIENKLSSVFIGKQPTLNQIEEAAINLPSEFFILTKENLAIVMIIFQNDFKREFLTLEMATNFESAFPFKFRGDITENRAQEIIKEKYDPKASIEHGKLKFNGKELKIISNQQLEEAVLALVKKEELDKKKPSKIFIPSQKEISEYILSETLEGGELDFFTEIKGQETDGIQLKSGVFDTKIGLALYEWGRACFDIGVNTVEDSYDIFSKYKGEELSQRDKTYIKMGFHKELEK